MTTERPSMMTPALVGGAVAGVLSAIPFLNCLCCLWIIGGAMLAAYLLAKDSPVSLTAGDGAVVGALSGIIAAAVDALLGIPLHAVNSQIVKRMMDRLAEFADEMPSGWESWLERSTGPISISLFLFGLLISAVIFAALGTLGGTIGASLFGKKRGPGPFPQGTNDAPQDPGYRQP